MKHMTLKNMYHILGGELHAAGADQEKEITGISIDSRTVKKDGLFIALKGERVDGHTFISDVMKKEAFAVICEKKPEEENIPYILVKDGLEALLRLAEFYRKQLDVKTIAITGSVGKTTTKEFIAAVLSQKYRVLKTKGNHNNIVGLPLTIFEITDTDELAVLEMGINQFGEMRRMAKAAEPDVCVMTNIGECHLEYLGSLEGVLEAKSEMLDYMQMDGTLISNGDDRMLLTISEPKAKHQIHFGLSKDNDVYATNVEDRGLFGTNCIIHGKQGEYQVQIPLPGQHMIYNALAAVSVGELFELTKEEIENGMQNVTTVGSRNNIIQNENYTIIDDCYNANPVSMRAAIDLLATSTTRTVAIIGDMGELGTDTISLHKNIGIYAKKKKIDQLIFIGKLAKYAAEAARDIENTSENVLYFSEKKDFYQEIHSILKEKDTILVKASNAAGFQEIVEYINS